MHDGTDPDERLSREIGRQATRRLRARRGDRRPWFGLGVYGVVGWSIVLPTLAGLALGVWIDGRWPSRYSWTLMLMSAGLLSGCWIAWRWVTLEQRAIHDDNGDSSTAGIDD